MPSRQNDPSLVHDRSKNVLRMGCVSCAEFGACGGLRIQSPIFDCAQLCECDSEEKRAQCNLACPLNPKMYVARLREVGGWPLFVPSGSPTGPNSLPNLVPMLKDRARREFDLAEPVVGVRLLKLWSRKTGLLLHSSNTLRPHFRIGEHSRILIDGIAPDQELEEYWSNPQRLELVRELSTLRPCLVTTPNFSLFNDVPRPENLYNMKRIAIVWSEFAAAGLPCSLHVNARTDKDYDRWIEFIQSHVEISHLSFEFRTGTAGTRSSWHVAQLTRLADSISRPLHLVVRGFVKGLRKLSKVYSGITILDTKSYVATLQRQLIELSPGGAVRYLQYPTRPDDRLDVLFAKNLRVQCQRAENLLHGA